MRGLFCSTLVLGLLLCAGPRSVEARSEGDCASAWSRAVRSYLTQNRRAAPDGTVPSDLDGEELAAQAWVDAFRPACVLEASGDGEGARIQAAVIGVQVLARLDPGGCQRFLSSYMESSRPQDICSAAAAGTGQDLSNQIASSIPPR